MYPWTFNKWADKYDVLDLYYYIWNMKRERMKVHKNNQPWYSGQTNKSWIPQLWASLFHVHLKAKVAVYTPFPCLALSVANRLYQWKQHQFVQDDTFS